MKNLGEIEKKAKKIMQEKVKKIVLEDERVQELINGNYELNIVNFNIDEKCWVLLLKLENGEKYTIEVRGDDFLLFHPPFISKDILEKI